MERLILKRCQDIKTIVKPEPELIIPDILPEPEDLPIKIERAFIKVEEEFSTKEVSYCEKSYDELFAEASLDQMYIPLTHLSTTQIYRTGKIKKEKNKETLKPKQEIKVEFYKCITCNGKPFTTSNGYESHLKKYHKERKYTKCEICGKIILISVNSTKCSNQMARHMMSVHSLKRNFDCKGCGRAFKTKSTLRDHEEIHKPKDIPCLICNKKFSTSRNYRRHLANHEMKNNYNCQKCKFKTHKLRLLKEHVGRIHCEVYNN